VAALCFESVADRTTELRHFSRARELVEWCERRPQPPMVGIDIPIGLPRLIGYRPCDLEARKILGRRCACVFHAPDRGLFGLSFTQTRSEVRRRREQDPTARGVTRQCHAITAKVAEVDELLREKPDREEWLFEVHPELTFRRLAGVDLPGKKRSAGQARRLELLESTFTDIGARLSERRWPRREVGVDDIIDAYAALYTAYRYAGGTGEVLRLGGLERDAEGVLARMVV
jgi:predicted RNase H-like nuclease